MCSSFAIVLVSCRNVNKAAEQKQVGGSGGRPNAVSDSVLDKMKTGELRRGMARNSFTFETFSDKLHELMLEEARTEFSYLPEPARLCCHSAQKYFDQICPFARNKTNIANLGRAYARRDVRWFVSHIAAFPVAIRGKEPELVANTDATTHTIKSGTLDPVKTQSSAATIKYLESINSGPTITQDGKFQHRSFKFLSTITQAGHQIGAAWVIKEKPNLGDHFTFNRPVKVLKVRLVCFLSSSVCIEFSSPTRSFRA